MSLRTGSTTRPEKVDEALRTANKQARLRAFGSKAVATASFVLTSAKPFLSELNTLGHVAEWLRNGLQNRVPRFNSGRGLQAPMRRVSCAGTTMIVLVVSVAPRGSLNAAEHG